MKIVKDQISIAEVIKMAEKMFGNLVKAVVDVEKEIIAIDGELHADEETQLLTQGSNQKDLWGINLYPDIEGDDWIEFDSMINIRPSIGNMTRGIEDEIIKKKIIGIIHKRIKK